MSRDFAQAATWFRRAADQGNASAQAKLGLMYVKGEGVPQDFAQAVNWSRKAADQGNAGGQTNIGMAYKNGEGVVLDYARGRHMVP